MVPCCKDSPTHCRILGLFSFDKQKCFQTLSNVPWGGRSTNLLHIENHWFQTVFLRLTGLCKITGQLTDPKIKVHKSLARQPSTKEGDMFTGPLSLGLALSHLPYLHSLFNLPLFHVDMWQFRWEPGHIAGERGNIMGNCFIAFQSPKARSFCILMKEWVNWKNIFKKHFFQFGLIVRSSKLLQWRQKGGKNIRTKVKRKNLNKSKANKRRDYIQYILAQS